MRLWNILMFEGFIGGDFELSHTNSGTPYIRLWVNNQEKGKTGYEVKADINVTYFGKGAEKFDGQKGDRVIIRGHLQTNEYNNKKYLGCLADRVDVVWRAGSKREEASADPPDDLPF